MTEKGKFGVRNDSTGETVVVGGFDYVDVSTGKRNSSGEPIMRRVKLDPPARTAQEAAERGAQALGL